ncbi:MAG: PspC domain-containing protein [Bifidobacterium sp.]|jgi:phage shock protein PspC (stress-responsive transcriptional regulator)|nr:PspC domain-containing protein [Bifidobacterium sp.]MCI1864823.1 PspC domain-containing protein [Bifidobacterium sp.]
MNDSHNASQPQWGPHNERRRQVLRFFSWIRESDLERGGEDRWIAGVCSALAHRYGYSVALVRSLTAASVLVFGLGAAFYAVAWMLLPDANGNVILAEELINGRWSWEMLGPLLCLAAALIVPRLGIGIAVVAIVLVLVLVRGLVSERRGPYGFPGDGGHRPPSQATRPPDGAQSARVPNGDEAASYDPSGAAPNTGREGDVRDYGTQAGGGYAYRYENRYRYIPPDPGPASGYRGPVIRRRRRGAGFGVVSGVVGLILLGAGAVLIVVRPSNLESLIRAASLWVAGMCVLLGMVIVVLGLMGRRSGGLKPFAWLAVVAALCLVSANLGYGAMMRTMGDATASYRHVLVRGSLSVHSGDALVERLHRGVVFTGSDAHESNRVSIDLSSYSASHPTHELLLANGSTVRSSCPTGTLSLAAYKTDVTLTLPSGCTYGLGDSRYYAYPTQAVVNRQTMTIGGPYSAWGTRDGRIVTIMDRGMAGLDVSRIHDVEESSSSDQVLPDALLPKNGPELYLDVPSAVASGITVRHASAADAGTGATTMKEATR